MPITKFTNLDFDQIKTSIKDYLRSNSKFTDFDFEGSNFSALIDTLAYNTYITAFNSNMAVNESFLDSATLRENVVSLASNIGYNPRSRSSAIAQVSIQATLNSDNLPSIATLKSGLICTGNVNDTSYIFSIRENTTGSISDNIATFNNVNIYQGTFLTKEFKYDGSLDQRFILNNENIDTSSIRVYVKNQGDSGLGMQYTLVDNVIDVTSTSQIFFVREIQDERYEIKFGDGTFGKQL